MKKNAIAIVIIAGLVTMYACKGNPKQAEQTNQTTASKPTNETKPSSASTEPKEYIVTVSPDNVLLGKNKEAAVKIENLKARELSSPDGQVTGVELTYDIEVTNNNKIGGSSFYINPNNFRLELDNGTKITHDDSHEINVQPEATALSSNNKFKLPAGAKPTALNLFYDETRATVKLELK